MAATDATSTTASSSMSLSRKALATPSSSRWIFTQEQLLNTPSIREGMHPEEELKRRRAAAQTIHQMADRLNHDSRVRISQLCICAAMMHMHRFFVFHSFYKFDPRDIAAACLFLAGKSEECPRKLEHIVRVWWAIKFPHTPNLETSRYHDAAQLIVTLENVILQTIAFDLSVDIPHTFVLNHMQNFARGNRKISEIAYWFASDMLHMTNWGVRFPARSIACVCIHLACLWAQFEIQVPAGSPAWYETVDSSMTFNKLLELAEEFTHIYKTYGEQLNIKKYAMRNSVANSGQGAQSQSRRNSQTQQPQAPSASLASLPPPPPAPELTTTAVKAEPRTEPARRIDLNDYKQRAAGVTSASTSGQTASQSSVQRRNFMQPDIPQNTAANKSSSDFELPLPPGIANEKKTAPAAPSLEHEIRQKRRAEEHDRDNMKHRRLEKADKSVSEGSSSQHRKRAHERTPVSGGSQHETTPVAPPSNHQSLPSGYSSTNSGSSSQAPRHHDTNNLSSSKRPKPPQSSSMPQILPPPQPAVGGAAASTQSTTPSQRTSTPLSTTGSQSRISSSHNATEALAHRPNATSVPLSHDSAYGSSSVNSLIASSTSSSHRHSSSMTSSSSRPLKTSSRENAPPNATELANGNGNSSNNGVGVTGSSSSSHGYSKRSSRAPMSLSSSPSSLAPLPPGGVAAHSSSRNITSTPSSHHNATYSSNASRMLSPLPPPPLPPNNDELEDGEVL